MRFDAPNAVAAMDSAVAAAVHNGDAWDVIGDSLTRPVHEVLGGYDESLGLELSPRPAVKRLEICGLAWGQLGEDAARLEGLAAALDSVAAVVRGGRGRLALNWSGESYDSF